VSHPSSHAPTANDLTASDAARRAAAVVKATTFYDDPAVVAQVSRSLGEAMVGINLDSRDSDRAEHATRYAGRGW